MLGSGGGAYEAWSPTFRVHGHPVTEDAPYAMEPGETVELEIILRVPEDGDGTMSSLPPLLVTSSEDPGTGTGVAVAFEWRYADLRLQNVQVQPMDEGTYLIFAEVLNAGGITAYDIECVLQDGTTGEVLDRTTIGLLLPIEGEEEPGGRHQAVAVIVFSAPSDRSGSLEIIVDPDGRVPRGDGSGDGGPSMEVPPLSGTGPEEIPLYQKRSFLLPAVLAGISGGLLLFLAVGRSRFLPPIVGKDRDEEIPPQEGDGIEIPE